MSDAGAIYEASLGLARPVQSYTAGAEIAAAHQRILAAQEAMNFNSSMKILDEQQKQRQLQATNEYNQAKLAEQAREADQRAGLQQSHWDSMANGKTTNGWVPPPPMPGSADASADPASAGGQDSTFDPNVGAYANTGRAADSENALRSGGGSPPSADPSVSPDFNGSPPVEDQSALAARPPPPGGLPSQRPSPQESANLGGGLLPSPRPDQAPAPQQAADPSLTPDGKPIKFDEVIRTGPQTGILYHKLPNGDVSVIDHHWDGRPNGAHDFVPTGASKILRAAKAEAKSPIVTDASGSHFVDGVEVELTGGRTTKSGTTDWSFRAKPKQPFEPDPSDPTKGFIKGAGGQNIPVTLEGIQQNSTGQISYRFKTPKSDATIESEVPEAQAKRARETIDAYKKLNMNVDLRLDKQGNFIPVVKEAKGEKAAKDVDNSIGALRRSFNEEEKGKIDMLLGRIQNPAPTVAEKKAIIDPKTLTEDPTKAWRDAWNKVQYNDAVDLAGMLNKRNQGKPGFNAVSPDELVKWGGRAPKDAMPKSEPPPIAAPQAPTAPPGKTSFGFSDEEQRAMGLRVPTASAAPPAAPPTPSWMKKLGI